MTLAELRFGIAPVGEVGDRAELGDWLARQVRPMFDRRVLPVSEDVMFKWRLLVEECRNVSILNLGTIVSHQSPDNAGGTVKDECTHDKPRLDHRINLAEVYRKEG